MNEVDEEEEEEEEEYDDEFDDYDDDPYSDSYIDVDDLQSSPSFSTLRTGKISHWHSFDK